MKLSWSWLGELVDLSGLEPSEIAHQLTMKTALIEEVEHVGQDLTDLQIGRVVEARPHPDADKLSVCQVETGKGNSTIVCGAPNVAAGQKVAVALPGAVLPGDFKIAERKLRGVMSQGMICSAKEIGLGEDHSGIMVLPEDSVVGQSLVDYMKLVDAVLDIDNKSITHRPDLWGHLGFARELSAIFRREMKALPLATDLNAGKGATEVRIEAPDICSRFLALTIRNFKSRPSPPWLQQRLLRCGMRPIHLAVDLSNLVMLELGQPTHPFDQKKIIDGIVVRMAKSSESLRTLDNVERTLCSDDLVIADHANQGRPISIAGVMGGADTEVDDDSDSIVLESANFDGVNLRATSTRLGLRTDALARFEKFLDPHLAETALRRYAYLVREHCPHAEIEREFSESSTFKYRTKTISVRPERVRRTLGIGLSLDDMKARLSSIEFSVEGDEQELKVSVPPHRATRDIDIEEDLIEEIGRLHGYENIEEDLPRVSCAPPLRDLRRELEASLTQCLVEQCNMIEVLDYSMVDDRSLALSGAPADQDYLTLRNPVTADTARMRRSLIPGMLRFLETNDRHTEAFKLFQMGRSYLGESRTEDGLPQETRELVLLEALGKRSSDRSYQALSALKGRLETVFRVLGYEGRWRPLEVVSPYWAHPTRVVAVQVSGKVAGVVGEVHPRILMKYGIDRDVALGCIDVDVWLNAGKSKRRFESLPKFPSVKIDLAIVAGYETTIEQIENEIRDEGRGIVRDVELFDVFVGKQVPDGKRSLAFRLVFRSDERTLKDQEVLEVRDRIVSRLEEKGLSLR